MYYILYKIKHCTVSLKVKLYPKYMQGLYAIKCYEGENISQWGKIFKRIQEKY